MQNDFDVIIIGGGLAGLSLTIQLAKAKQKVLLIEKEEYPFHKVCGEYISLESAPFLSSLGFDHTKFDLPLIDKLTVSTPSGRILNTKLPLGGFGVSRYFLDNELYKIALLEGAAIITGDKVTDILFDKDQHNIALQSGKTFTCKIAAGSYGKRSNVDKILKRKFVDMPLPKKQNYIGVKYHIKYNVPADRIALHNFSDGYCGISAIEDGKACLCYLTTASNLEKCGNNIHTMEEKILFRNPFLKDIFEKAERVYDKPLVISQINFTQKELINDHVLFLGDAAGLITPLCGNGMSMALHASFILHKCLLKYLQNKITRVQLEEEYISNWNNNFKTRLRAGRIFQKMFGNKFITEIFIGAVKPVPFIVNKLISLTHGENFLVKQN